MTNKLRPEVPLEALEEEPPGGDGEEDDEPVESEVEEAPSGLSSAPLAAEEGKCHDEQASREGRHVA